MLRRCGLALVACALAIGASGCGGDGDARDLVAFCEALSEAAAPGGPIASVALDDETTVRAAIDTLDSLALQAPDDLRADVRVVRDAFASLVTDLAAAPARGHDDVLRAHEEQLAAADESARRLESFARTICGAELAPPPDRPTPTPTPLSIQG